MWKIYFPKPQLWLYWSSLDRWYVTADAEDAFLFHSRKEAIELCARLPIDPSTTRELVYVDSIY